MALLLFYTQGLLGRRPSPPIPIKGPFIVYYDLESGTDGIPESYADFNLVMAYHRTKGWYKQSGHKYDIMVGFWNWIEHILDSGVCEYQGTQWLMLNAFNGSSFDHLPLFAHLMHNKIHREWQLDFHVYKSGDLKYLRISSEKNGKYRVVSFVDTCRIMQSSLAQLGAMINLPSLDAGN